MNDFEEAVHFSQIYLELVLDWKQFCWIGLQLDSHAVAMIEQGNK
jgi:hypothetical protein